MPKVSAILVDDEVYSLEDLAITLEQNFPDIHILAKASSVDTAKAEIELHRPDILFLDIQINELSAFDLLDMFTNPTFGVVIVSGYKDFGIKAVKYGVIDYLLKPVDLEDLRNAVEKVNQFVIARQQQIPSALSSDDEKIIVNSALGFHLVKIKDIIRLEAAANYTNIILKDPPPIFISKTLMEFEKILSSYNFFRVHRSHLVNIEYIKEYTSTANGRYVTMVDNVKIEIAKTKVKDIMFYVEKIYRNKI